MQMRQNCIQLSEVGGGAGETPWNLRYRPYDPAQPFLLRRKVSSAGLEGLLGIIPAPLLKNDSDYYTQSNAPHDERVRER